MSEIKLGVVEARFADIIWNHEPLSSNELVRLCEHELNWKKPTTYTVLRKLCERGIFVNKDSVVTSLMTKQEFLSIQSERFVEDAFDGSLPAFIAAFTSKKPLSEKEIAEIRRMIDSAGEV